MKTTPTAAAPHIYAMTGAPRGGVDVASELRRLMPRDRWLLELLAEHQVLTTEQAAALGFEHVHTARNRLLLLNQRGILARFRDAVRPGSQSWRWTLDLVGATYIAARTDQPTPKAATIRHRINKLATNPHLSHLLGVNGLFVDLASYARTTPGARLGVWWSERTCRQITGDLVHPDGHGVWTHHGATRGFWLEYDLGTEKRHQIAAKIDGYAALHRATGLDHAVLIWLSTPGRETSLHKVLAAHPAIRGGALVVATASGEQTHPAAPVWLPVGQSQRVRLAEVPIQPGRNLHAARPGRTRRAPSAIMR